MILSGETLRDLFTSGTWKTNVKPRSLHYNPNSIDVTLSPNFYVTRSTNNILDPYTSSPEDFFYLMKDQKELLLLPKQFILASVNERFDCSEPVNGNRYFTQIYDGRSTIARLGVLSHISAGYGDYGFTGAFTLEIVNNSPWVIKLHAGMRIGQVYFEELDSKAKDMVYQGYKQQDCIPGLPRLGINRF